MNVEILAIGTEMLLGQIINTNAAEIASRLADHGLNHQFQGVVGDNPGRMEAALRQAIARSDAVILTGGIGPTQDDVTREVVAAVADVPLIFDGDYAETMRRRWEQLGRHFPESNLKQAYHPQGAIVVENPRGSAPGFILDVDGCLVVSLPGVPIEMLGMLDDQVIPFLMSRSGTSAGVVTSRVLKSWGLSEAAVGERLDDLFTSSVNPTMAFLASAGVIKVRLTARGRTPHETEALIAPMEAEVRRRLGDHIFGVDGDTIEGIIQQQLRDRSWTIGTAESATGGLVATQLTAVPGSSATFRGSIIAYAPDLKVSRLGVPVELLETSGIVSEDTALAMARGARTALGVDVAVAVTGSAGPDPLEVDVGTMCVAVVTPIAERSRTFHMPGDRERIRTYTATAALHQVRLTIDAS